MISLLIISAPPRATFTLAAEVLMALALLVGALFARRGQYRVHHYWQSSIVLLNLLLIAVVMLPSFDRNVLPQFPASLGIPYYTFVIVHATLGLIVQLLALYVILAAGTNLLPKRWRFTRFTPWMRTTLALWWLVVLLGAVTYDVWYVQASPLVTTPASTSQRLVTVRDFQFQPKTITVAVGATVIWRDVQGMHTVHADRGAFRSSPLVSGRSFQYTFRHRGTYLYHCDFHGAPGGVGMSGRVVVVSRPSS